MQQLNAGAESWPLEKPFTIARGTKQAADVVVVEMHHVDMDGVPVVGRAECVPYSRYGETVRSVLDEILTLATNKPDDFNFQAVQEMMSPGAARNAIDCALWDLTAKCCHIRVADHLGITPAVLDTAFTISLGTPNAMREEAAHLAARPMLKVKISAEEPEQCVRAVRKGAPESRLIVDANEALDPGGVEAFLEFCAEMDVALVEQPLPAGEDAILGDIPRAVAVAADESAHISDDLETVAGRYDVVNIKLDKTGGLTEALAMKQRARELGLGIMIGCMVGTSLAMAPALLLAHDAEFVDLDGPYLLKQDREFGLCRDDGRLNPALPQLWG